jgi:hypothetical protein
MKACRLFFEPVETPALSSTFWKEPVSLFTTEPCSVVEESLDAPEAVPEAVPEALNEAVVSEPHTTPYMQCFLSLKRLSEVPPDLMGGDMVRIFWKTAFQIFAAGVCRLSLPKFVALRKNILRLPIEVLEEVFEMLKWMGEEDVDLAEISHEYVVLLKIVVASQHRNDAMKACFLRKLRLAFFACPS